MASMNTPLLRTALRRALILSLAVPALAEDAGCGGTVVLDQNGSSSSASGTGGTGTTVAAGTGTTVAAGNGGSFSVVAVGVGGSFAVGGAGGSVTTGGCALASMTPVFGINAGCELGFDLTGPASDCSPGPGGELTKSQCAMLCPPNPGGQSALSCNAQDQPQPPVEGLLTCVYSLCGTGRRPAGLAPAGGAEAAATGEVARFLGEVAHLEAASVVAFEQLAGELETHGAPRRLVRAARRAAREEVRHARVMRRFAERAGAPPRPVEVAATAPRPIEAIAIENAVEGCVRETFGAVLAMRQAERARSGDLRRAMKGIARDEAGHAELAWELGRWLDGRLDAAARRRVRAAQDRAVEALARDATREPDARLVAELGVPTRAEARAAIEALRASIWAPAARAA
jgi:hypothetical protein